MRQESAVNIHAQGLERGDLITPEEAIGALSGTGLVDIHPMNNSHCDVKSRVLRERPKLLIDSQTQFC